MEKKENTINLDELSSYIKNSEVYGALVKKGVKTISRTTLRRKTIPLFDFSKTIKTMDQFKKALKTIYFWKIQRPYPVNFYVSIYKNNKKNAFFLDDSLLKYDNDVVTYLKEAYYSEHDLMFSLDKIISMETNYELLDYVIDNKFFDYNVFFEYLCQNDEPNITIIKYMFDKLKTQLDFNNCLSIAIECNVLDVIKFLIEYAIKTKKQDMDLILFDIIKIFSIYININIIEYIVNYLNNFFKNGGNTNAIINLFLYSSVQNNNLNTVKYLLSLKNNFDLTQLENLIKQKKSSKDKTEKKVAAEIEKYLATH